MRLFGKKLFEQKVPDTLYDFAQHGVLRRTEDSYVDVASIRNEVSTARKKKAKKEAPAKTPKELHQAKTLNIPELAINCDPEYLDKEIAVLKEKLALFGPEPPKSGNRHRHGLVMEEYGAKYFGRQELKSMIERLEARRRFKEVDLSEYPYTTSEAISLLLSNYSHLRVDEATSMVPDLPADAISAMKKYEKATLKVTGKKPVFYLIKEQKDEQKVQRSRDPILLAQSPFGFVWQILGAWDEEIRFLDEL